MRRLAIPLLTSLALLAAAAPASAAVPHRDIPYNLGPAPPDPNEKALDVYQPDGAAATDERPVVVYVHGGAWRVGDKRNQINDKVSLFTGAGYLFVSLNYRLSPQDPTILDPGRVRFPAHPDDVGEALGWLSRNVDDYGGDPTRLLLIGHSAGAHLVSLVSTDRRYTDRWGVEPWQLIGTVGLDSDAYDVADRIAEVAGTDAEYTFWNAFATPQENAADRTWATASPIVWADFLDPRHLLVTQAGARQRVADNQAMASALRQDPAAVFQAPYNHEGINDAVGGADDPAGETVAIMDFFRSMVADSADPKIVVLKRPGRRVRAHGGEAKVRFVFESNIADSKIFCGLNGRRPVKCRGEKTMHLKPGKHVLRIQAYNRRGRPGPEKTFRFKVVGNR